MSVSSHVTHEDQESIEQQQILMELTMILSTVQEINTNLTKLIDLSKDPQNIRTIQSNIELLYDLMDKLQ